MELATFLLESPGSSANLTCSNKTWKDILFVTWKLQLTNKECLISISIGESRDNCSDGKSIRNTSMAPLVLNIPNVSSEGAGVYTCKTYYNGGDEEFTFIVSVIVPPKVNAWRELRDGKMVAVCEAEGGNPAANISWSFTGNLLTYKSELSDGLFRVESSLEVPEGVDPENISCVVSHPSWQENRKLVPRLQTGKAYSPWILLILVMVVVLLGVLFFAQKKLIIWRRCQKSDSTSLTPPPREDVEEVEPYASYVQRVNSIYGRQ
ncbi:cell surface glycoprotein CD200 receptor 1 isoform X2 [Gouania willdenowi]|uniref:cell surface glycoprotein CD200 receptor 1 isoform X2 n=1 Tax=Gouania willdenowi TaxID=441366 RepID=UPI0010543E7F|nr:cell surface glycoprotein CD200 receptor 1-like isoform X2 [Gouania willdenowi]